jgi:hypothetical protein
MGWFKKKTTVTAEPLSTCVHKYQISDVNVRESHNGTEVDFDDRITVVCTKCSYAKIIDELGLSTLKVYGLIE